MDQTVAKAILGSVLALGSVGCGTDSDRISEVHTLRVLAVRAESPFVRPGSATQLSVLAFDGSPRATRTDGAKRTTSTLWIGGCTNPPGDSFAACNPYLHEVLSVLGEENLASGVVPDDAPPGFVGWGQTFEAHLAPDIIESRAVAPGVVNRYGLQIVFVAHCGGVLRRVTEDLREFPLGCFDARTGEQLGRDDFEFGFYPLFAYETVTNENPVLNSLTFAGEGEGVECSSELPCAEGYHCGVESRCLPVVARCTAEKADDCEKHSIGVDVPTTSVERAVLAHVSEAEARPETIWVSYYASAGSFEQDAELINEPNTGWNANPNGVWRANTEGNREVRVWAVVRDNRNGVAWSWRDVWVE